MGRHHAGKFSHASSGRDYAFLSAYMILSRSFAGQDEHATSEKFYRNRKTVGLRGIERQTERIMAIVRVGEM